MDADGSNRGSVDEACDAFAPIAAAPDETVEATIAARRGVTNEELQPAAAVMRRAAAVGIATVGRSTAGRTTVEQ